MNGKEKFLAGVLGMAGTGVLAWRAFCPWLAYDIQTIKASKRAQKATLKDISERRFLIDMFEETSHLHPERIFIIYEDREYSYRMVNEMANKVASIVSRWDIKTGGTVAMMIYNSPEFVWTFLGILKLGIAGTFINYHLQEEPLAHSLTASQSKHLIIGQGDELLESIKSVQEYLPAEFHIFVYGRLPSELPYGYNSLEELMIYALPTPICKAVREKVTYTDPVCYIYTSGTTGLPKPSIINQARTIRQSHGYLQINFTHRDVTYVVTPLYHSAATIVGVANTIGAGAKIVLRKKFSATQFWEDVRKHKVTVIQYIGELCRYLLKVPKHPLDGVHSVRVAYGNGLRKDIWEEFQSRFKIPQIYEFFGSTEGTSALLNCCNKVGSVGRWSPITRRVLVGGGSGMYIVKYDPITEKPIRDKDGRCVTINPGEVGLLLGEIPPTHTRFYLGPKEMDEKKTVRNAFIDGDAYFDFGDAVYLDKEYFVYFRDRIGDTFRWKGENVSTTEVANILSVLKFIHDANVYGVPIPGNDGKAGMAAIQMEENFKINANYLKMIYNHVVKHLPHYARPIFLRLVQSFVITQTMKHRKLEFVAEGFDVNIVKDPLYVLSHVKQTYMPLNESNYTSVLSARL